MPYIKGDEIQNEVYVLLILMMGLTTVPKFIELYQKYIIYLVVFLLASYMQEPRSSEHKLLLRVAFL